MSKKMLKRSLALGALMAFVITGSAMAAKNVTVAELDSVKTVNERYTHSNDTQPGGWNTPWLSYLHIDMKGNNLTFEGGFGDIGHSEYCHNGFDIKDTGNAENNKLVSKGTIGGFGSIDVGTLEVIATGKYALHAQGLGLENIDSYTGNDNDFGMLINANTVTLKSTKNNVVQVDNANNKYNGGKITFGDINRRIGSLTIDASEGERPIRVTGTGDYVKIYADKFDVVRSIEKPEETMKADGNSSIFIDALQGNVDGDFEAGANGTVDVKLGSGVNWEGKFVTVDNATKGALDLSGTWNLTEASSLTNATFNAGSTLVIEGKTFDVKEGSAVYALNGVGDKATLTVKEGAKLKINGITETTYNIAKGFNNLEGAVDKWEVSDINALMQGVAWTTKDGLQVEVFAKKASDMANDTGMSTSTAGLVQSIIENAKTADTPAEKAAVEFIEKVQANNSAPEAVGNAINNATKMGEAGGNSATAASIVKNVTGVTNDRLSFNCGHSAPHKGGHGVGLFEEGSGADVWVEYVHGKDEVEDMPSTAGASSYEGQYNGIVMGVDFKKVNKFQSGIAFNYGEGDTNSVGNAVRTHSDYDFWGVGYYGSIHNDDSNVIFDINYAKTDSDVTQNNSGTAFEANPETTTWSAGIKLEKLYQNENVQIVPYTGLRYMSIDADDYSTRNGEFYYSMDRQDIWLLPLGVSIRQEIANDNGWTVSPRVDLSYIWAFGDTNSNMEVKSPFAGVSQLGYDVMDDGSFLGLVGIEAHKGQWGFGVSYSYQKGDYSTSKKWFIDANYSF